MAAAISSGAATRPAGAWLAGWGMTSPNCAVPSVLVGPGLTALTRTPLGPSSAAQARVSWARAALVAPYRPRPGIPTLAAVLMRLTTAPPPCSAMPGASSRTRTYGARTLVAEAASMVSAVVSAVVPESGG